MLFDVTHITEFSYSQPVFLEPHSVRLRPRCDSWQRLLGFDMRVEPPPAGISECIDLDGNTTARLWFNGSQEALTITTTFTAETLHTNPFDFILDPTALVLPIVYREEFATTLAPYCDHTGTSHEVTRFAEVIAREAGMETVPFLGLITHRIHETCEAVVRHHDDPWPASVTLAERRGACRDLAVLLTTACRAVGLAARFVSGYQAGDPEQTERELHAWAEVYLPGAGWRGYDPMRGTAVSDQHVALAAGLTPRAAAPTSGTFRGTGATSTLHTDVSMIVTSGEPEVPDIKKSQTFSTEI